MYFSKHLWGCKGFKINLEDANEITISEKNHRCILSVWTHHVQIKRLETNGISCLGFPGGATEKAPTCQRKRHRFSPWVGNIPWRRAWQPTLVFLPGDSLDRGAWWATVHQVIESQTPLKWVSIFGLHIIFSFQKAISYTIMPFEQY